MTGVVAILLVAALIGYAVQAAQRQNRAFKAGLASHPGPFEPPYFVNGRHPIDYDDPYVGHLHLVSINRRDVPARIEYRDANEGESDRKIDIRDAYADDRDYVYLKAFCYLRSDFRTFRADRVTDVIDADGVVLPTREFIEHRMGVRLWPDSIRYRRI